MTVKPKIKPTKYSLSLSIASLLIIDNPCHGRENRDKGLENGMTYVNV